ncbi:DUF4157 domain-containing protein [Uliginosibacterium sp. H3]|uniref:DUF4157 domain-containing protein n=1 Tax=Uliginosibacterium silvisoli TaxID=3114758 RepID=A0ABU6K1F8_9RHOO|nr:DUF4157 domain-containing protein [Uliginosibacterium sp. H3]
MKYAPSKSSASRSSAAKPAPRGRTPGALRQPMAGMPRYVRTSAQTRVPLGRPGDGLEAEADHVAQRLMNSEPAASTAGRSSAAHAAATSELVQASGSTGRPLDAHTRSFMEQRMGTDLSQVRVHTGSAAARMNRGLGAEAFTHRQDIFFGEGKTPGADELTAHELTHVVQQAGGSRDAGISAHGGTPAVQRSLTAPQATDMGVFNMAMITQPTPPGLMGTISFMPDADGPYSAEIGLIQAINITDVPGTSSGTPNTPVDWSQVTDGNSITPTNPAGTVGTEAGRMDLMTTGNDAAAAGVYIDSMTATNPSGSQIGPNYVEHFGNSRQFGWLRSATDRGPAELFDYPSFSFDTNFDFETVAKGTDNQVVYGGVEWGFQIRSGAVIGSSEYARPINATSVNFDEALERFRGYFTHEPVVLYFDTDQELPVAGEESKLAGIREYMDNYPDASITIEGFADIRGSEEHNFGLSDRRAQAAQSLVVAQGIDASRIDGVFGVGETQEFSEHGTAAGARQPVDAGRLRANRRVVISFNRSASALIVVP